MPYNKLDLSTGNTLIYKAEGKITKEDYTENLIPEIQKILDTGSKTRLVFDITEMHFHDVSWAAMWEDTKFGITKMDAFEKVAVVTHHEKLIALFTPLFHGIEFDTFTDQETAISWIFKDLKFTNEDKVLEN